MYLHAGFKLDDHQQEITPFSSPDFQYRYVSSTMTTSRSVPWHWHNALEFVHILEGASLFSLPQKDILVPEDAIIIINSEISHSCGTANPAVPARYHTQMINPDLLAGGVGSFIKSKYFDPILQCHELPYFLITPDMPCHAEAVRFFEAAYVAVDTDDGLMELKICQYLTQLWLTFIESTADIWRNPTRQNNVRSQRINRMITFIQQNCTEKLTLEDIAASADISTRECLRCFQTLLNTTPFEFLLDCRVRLAADMLHKRSDSITNIALSCGFSSSSYFCRVFKKITGSTPSEFLHAKD